MLQFPLYNQYYSRITSIIIIKKAVHVFIRGVGGDHSRISKKMQVFT